MKITFDTNEDVEHLKEIQQLIGRLIHKQRSDDSTSEIGGFDIPVQSTPSSPSPSSSAPSGGMFSIFSDTTSAANSAPSPSTPDPYSQSPPGPEEERKDRYRIMEY